MWGTGSAADHSERGTVLHLRRAALVAALALAPLTAALPATASTADDVACPDGIPVVVDATELEGEVEVGCADDSPATGTEALTQAGFTDTRDGSGLICAISDLPDPCPETFEGQYWSYWYVADGEWQTWMEGSDTAAPGEAEGWRWGDGTTPPDVDPAALLSAPEAAETSDPPTMTATETDVADQSEDGGAGWSPIAIGGVVIAVLLVVATGFVARRRRGV